jgi:hypothetical protein
MGRGWECGIVDQHHGVLIDNDGTVYKGTAVHDRVRFASEEIAYRTTLDAIVDLERGAITFEQNGHELSTLNDIPDIGNWHAYVSTYETVSVIS